MQSKLMSGRQCRANSSAKDKKAVAARPLRVNEEL